MNVEARWALGISGIVLMTLVTSAASDHGRSEAGAIPFVIGLGLLIAAFAGGREKEAGLTGTRNLQPDVSPETHRDEFEFKTTLAKEIARQSDLELNQIDVYCRRLQTVFTEYPDFHDDVQRMIAESIFAWTAALMARHSQAHECESLLHASVDFAFAASLAAEEELNDAERHAIAQTTAATAQELAETVALIFLDAVETLEQLDDRHPFRVLGSMLLTIHDVHIEHASPTQIQELLIRCHSFGCAIEMQERGLSVAAEMNMAIEGIAEVGIAIAKSAGSEY